MTTYEAARIYTRRMGLSVIPIEAHGKKAALPWKSFQVRLANPDELKRWFQLSEKKYNLAIVTGKVSGQLLVLDFDDLGQYSLWKQAFGMETLTCLTGKGIHAYFRLRDLQPTVRNGKFGVNGVPAGDIRYNGGYVLAPPSIHPSGKIYTWGAYPLLSVYFEELQITLKTPLPSNVRLKPVPFVKSSSYGLQAWVQDPVNYCRTALRNELLKISQAGDGNRNDTLFTAGLKLKKYTEVLGENTVFESLIEAGCKVGLPQIECERTVKSAFSY